MLILICQQGKYDKSLGIFAVDCPALECGQGSGICRCVCLFQGNKGTEKHLFIAYIKMDCTADSVKIPY